MVRSLAADHHKFLLPINQIWHVSAKTYLRFDLYQSHYDSKKVHKDIRDIVRPTDSYFSITMKLNFENRLLHGTESILFLIQNTASLTIKQII